MTHENTTPTDSRNFDNENPGSGIVAYTYNSKMCETKQRLMSLKTAQAYNTASLGYTGKPWLKKHFFFN